MIFAATRTLTSAFDLPRSQKTFRMKTILVPVDFSEHAENALRAAAVLAKRHKAKLVVMHMVGFDNSLLTKEYQDEVMESIFHLKLTQKRFEEFLNKPYLEDIEIEQYVQKLKVFREIDVIARKHGADLIVMGSHGSSGINEVFVGSNTEKVIRSATIPVLVIKDAKAESTCEHVVFACDYNVKNVQAYKRAKELFKTLGAEMHLLYINLPGLVFISTQELEERIHEFFKAAGDPDPIKAVGTVAQYTDYSLQEGLFAYSERVGADVIAIPTHGRQGISHFLKGSISEDVANRANIAVMTFKM